MLVGPFGRGQVVRLKRAVGSPLDGVRSCAVCRRSAGMPHGWSVPPVYPLPECHHHSPFFCRAPLLASIELMAETFKIAFCVSYLVVLGDLVRDAVGSEHPPRNTMDTTKKKMPTLRFQSGEDLQLYRRKHGMNQGEFWGKVGVTQSGGSRYESGRNVPKPVQILLHITYGTPKESEKLVGWLRDK